MFIPGTASPGQGDKINRCDEDYADKHFVNPLLLGQNYLIPFGMLDEVAESPQETGSGSGFILARSVSARELSTSSLQ
jgi:hypothetical protein